MMIADVALLSPPYGTLSYSLPRCLPGSVWRVGMRVAVPLGKTCRAGVILNLGNATGNSAGPNTSAMPAVALKDIVWPLEAEPLLSPAYLDLVVQLGLRQSVPPGRILGTVLPAPLRSGKQSLRLMGSGKRKVVAVKDISGLDEAEKAALAEAWQEGRAVCAGGSEDPLDCECCQLVQDPPWPVRPRAARQMALLEYLLEKGSPTRRQLLADLGPEAASPLAVLVARGLVRLRPVADDDDDTGSGSVAEDTALCSWSSGFSLTQAQQEVLDALMDALETGKSSVHLVHGVTGSGKSVVYMALAHACLARGRSVMLLAPEVALAHKLRADAALHLPGAPVFFFHGYQSVKERERTFRALAVRRAPSLVIGTRSALFLPVASLGVAILDEEHDTSFKQDEGLPYQAKEVAWYRTDREKALLVLGSATPDVKTYHAATRGVFPLHTLANRVGGGVLPSVRLVDAPPSSGGGQEKSILARESIEALDACVERGEQAVILLNRRGYAPLMYCLSCGVVLRCPQCAISLTYHKGRERAVCHYCGHAASFPSPCPSCGGMHFLPMGEGTEKLEESLVPKLKTGTRILRLDRDSTRRVGAMERILSSFANKEAQVLVGTQMLSKGHHFPDVTLVIAADADLGLNLPDYRAAEKTFQLMVQASGRAGRGEKKGEVIIQTRDRNHYCWHYVTTGDYEGFYTQEIARREQRRYPPFINLALLRMSFAQNAPRGAALMEEVAAVVRRAGREKGMTVLGPAPAPIALLRGMRRYHCLIKTDSWAAVRDVYAQACVVAGTGGTLRLGLDLDPVNML